MASREVQLGVGLAVLFAGVWYVWLHGARTHNLTLPEETVSAIGFWPYAWWCGSSRGQAYTHHYPDRVGPNVLPLVLQTEEGTLSVQDSEVGRG